MKNIEEPICPYCGHTHKEEVNPNYYARFKKCDKCNEVYLIKKVGDTLFVDELFKPRKFFNHENK